MRFKSSLIRVLTFIGVTIIILLLYIPNVFVFLRMIFPDHPVISTICLIVVHIGVLMIFLTYFFSVFSDPGFYEPSEPLIDEESIL